MSGARIFRIINRKPLIEIDAEGGESPPESGVAGLLQLQGVSFAYPARPDVTIFEDFSLTVPAGVNKVWEWGGGVEASELAGDWVKGPH